MSTNEPDASPQTDVPTSRPDAISATIGRPRRLIAIAVGAGILAGVASWAIGETLLEAFRPPLHEANLMGHKVMKAEYEDQAAADFKNATLAFTLLGVILGACLGYAGGRARGSDRRGIRAGLAAMALGGVLAGAGSLALLSIYFREEARFTESLTLDLTLPLIVHGGIAAAAGLAGGLGLGIGMGLGPAGSVKPGIGGMIGAALGATIFIVLGAVIFSGSNTTAPLATTWPHRLLARLLVAALAGLLAATFAVLEPRKAADIPS